MKKLAIILAFLLVAVSAGITGCGRLYETPYTGALPRTVPHQLSVQLNNCNVCHVNDQLAVASIPHDSFTEDLCTLDGCHGALVYTTPNTSPISRPITHLITYPLEDCVACHLPDETGIIIPHTPYTDNTLCLNPGCHATGTLPPTTPTTPPPTTTPTTSTTQPTTSTPGGTPSTTPTTPTETTTPTGTPTETTTPGGPPVLDMTALPLDLATHPQAYSALCMLCHGPGMGVQQYPLPPVWDGTPITPGPYTITPGSDQDHTGRTDTATCVTQTGCHKAPW
jgi:hypothetical protein